MRIEIRGDSVLIDGYVNAVLRDSKPLTSRTGKFVEQIVPKAFERSLERNDNVDVLLNHKRKLSSTKDGFELYEDSIGLHARGTITDPGVMEKARARKLSGWSFGFIPKQERVEPGPAGMDRRFVEDLDLIEVSILDDTESPAYIATSIEVRQDDCIVREYRQSETEIRYEIDEEPKIQAESQPPLFDNSEYKKRLNDIRK